MGLLDTLFPATPNWRGGSTPNPFVNFWDQNRNTIGSAFGGLVGAANPHDAIAGFTQGLNAPYANQADAAFIQSQKAQTQAADEVRHQQTQQNLTIADLKRRGRADLVAAIKSGGLSVPEAWKMALAGDTASDETWGLTPQAYSIPDEKGVPVTKIGVMSNKGNFKEVPLPAGGSPLFPVNMLNTGTEFTGVGKFGGLTGDSVTINNETAAEQKAMGDVIGKAAADRIVSLPQTLATSDNMVSTIDGILNDPALDYSTGWLSWMQAVPNTDQYRFGQRALQLQGQAFLKAFDGLRGGGQITETEGAKATQAIGRLSTAQSPTDYRDALNELRTIITAAKMRAISLAGTAPGVPPVAGGTDYKTKYGLE